MNKNSFKSFYLTGKNNSHKTLNSDERSYLNKIVDTAEGIYSRNKTLNPDVLLDLSTKEIIRQEMEVIEKQIRNASITALDVIKDKYPKEETDNEPRNPN